jgi:hypothetical protein
MKRYAEPHLRRNAFAMYSYCRGYAPDFQIAVSEGGAALTWSATIGTQHFGGIRSAPWSNDKPQLGWFDAVMLLDEADRILSMAALRELIRATVRAARPKPAAFLARQRELREMHGFFCASPNCPGLPVQGERASASGRHLRPVP